MLFCFFEQPTSTLPSRKQPAVMAIILVFISSPLVVASPSGTRNLPELFHDFMRLIGILGFHVNSSQRTFCFLKCPEPGSYKATRGIWPPRVAGGLALPSD